MSNDSERTPLLDGNPWLQSRDGTPAQSQADLGATLVDGSAPPSAKDEEGNVPEQLIAQSAVGERLPYSNYTTIDWLHDLVRELEFCSLTGQWRGAAPVGLATLHRSAVD